MPRRRAFFHHGLEPGAWTWRRREEERMVLYERVMRREECRLLQSAPYDSAGEESMDLHSGHYERGQERRGSNLGSETVSSYLLWDYIRSHVRKTWHTRAFFTAFAYLAYAWASIPCMMIILCPIKTDRKPIFQPWTISLPSDGCSQSLIILF